MSASETSTVDRAPRAPRKGRLLNGFLNRLATPLTTGLFAISTISGVALFFHWQSRAFHSMHEWLSMILLLPFAFHVWKNWRSLIGYLKRGTLVIPVVLCLLAGVPFAYSSLTSTGSGGNPAVRVVSLLTEASLAELAPALKTTPDALLTTLMEQGFQVESTDQTLAAVAKASGKRPTDVVFALLPSTP